MAPQNVEPPMVDEGISNDILNKPSSEEGASIEQPVKPSQVNPWCTEAYQLDLSGMAKQVVINSLLLSKEVDRIELMVDLSIQPMMNDKIKSDVEAALKNFYGTELVLNLQFSAQLNAETPSQYQQRMEDEDRQKFIDELNNSEFGITMKQNFNAVLLEHSVKRIDH